MGRRGQTLTSMVRNIALLKRIQRQRFFNSRKGYKKFYTPTRIYVRPHQHYGLPTGLTFAKARISKYSDQPTRIHNMNTLHTYQKISTSRLQRKIRNLVSDTRYTVRKPAGVHERQGLIKIYAIGSAFLSVLPLPRIHAHPHIHMPPEPRSYKRRLGASDKNIAS